MPSVPSLNLRTQPIRVLLVEDDQGDAGFVQWVLARSSAPCFEVIRAARMSAALPIVRSSGCDVVLLDLGLPDSPGLARLEEFSLAAPRIPVIVLTGLGEEDEESTVLRVIGRGAQDYFVKGRSDLQALGRSIRIAIERKAFEERLARRGTQ